MAASPPTSANPPEPPNEGALREALERAGWRHTRQRAEVFAYLRSVDTHPTAEQVFASVRPICGSPILNFRQQAAPSTRSS